MSEFHRMITYLYLYENNHKTRNVGFAKIEKRDAQCRVEIHMKNTGHSLSELPVYFYAQSKSQFQGIPLGSVNLIRGNGEFNGTFDAENLVNTGFPLSSVKGIFLPLSEHGMLLSQWDDDEFDRTLFTTSDPSPQTEPPLPEEEPVILKAAEAAPELSAEPPSPKSSLSAEEAENLEHKWNFITKNFPIMTPFPDEDPFVWVKLELKDLRLLPKSYWYLGNNSFLLHGFFNYHHLLLGRKEDSQSSQWALGIPGVFQNPERVIATVFGFPEFISTPDDPLKTEQMGYWLRYLE